MKLNRSATELLNRYILGVKRELGGRERDDIAAEIESYIYDLLEERYPGDREINREELETILKEMGSPRKVAGQYSPQRYLIGPRLFPVYWLVLRIVVAVVTGALLLSLVIESITNPTSDILKMLSQYPLAIRDGILSTAASITIVFAIIERVTEGKRLEEIEELKELKIDELPELPEEERPFSLVGISIEAALGVLGLAFFSYIRGTGGALPVILNPDTQMQMARVFTDNYLKFIPVILGLTGLEVARNIMLLVQARHSSITNWWDIALKAGSMVLNGFMLGALPLVTLEYFQTIFQISDLSGWNATANTALAVILGLGIFGNLIEIIKKIVREIRNPAY